MIIEHSGPRREPMSKSKLNFPDRVQLAALLAALSAALACPGCGGKTPGAPPPGGPPEVGVLTISEQPVPLTLDLPGRTAALRIAEVRARVNGIVVKRFFREGAEVKEGEV